MFRLLADIALRALSPAVNDPATAAQVLDTVESLLQALVSRDFAVAYVADDPPDRQPWLNPANSPPEG